MASFLSIRTLRLFNIDHSLHFCVSWFYRRRWHCRRLSVEVQQWSRPADRSSSMQITMAMPPLNRTQELYFAGLIFMVCQSTAKTAKIGPLENFPLYGIWQFLIQHTSVGLTHARPMIRHISLSLVPRPSSPVSNKKHAVQVKQLRCETMQVKYSGQMGMPWKTYHVNHLTCVHWNTLYLVYGILFQLHRSTH